MRSDARVRTTDHRTFRPVATGLAALLLATLVTATPSRAASMTTSETLGIPMTQTNWGIGTPGVLAFKMFDPALGTLNSVQISLDSFMSHDISLTFPSPSTLTESTVGSQVVVNDPNGKLLLAGALPSVSQSRTVSTGPFPQTATIPTITQSKTAGPLTLNTPADLALFTATTANETIKLPLVAQSNSQFVSSTGNGSGQIKTVAGANVTVSYNYTPVTRQDPANQNVPEPSTLAIVGLGCAALLANRRRAAAR
jgi:PEP-CTERM motif